MRAGLKLPKDSFSQVEQAWVATIREELIEHLTGRREGTRVRRILDYMVRDKIDWIN